MLRSTRPEYATAARPRNPDVRRCARLAQHVVVVADRNQAIGVADRRQCHLAYGNLLAIGILRQEHTAIAEADVYQLRRRLTVLRTGGRSGGLIVLRDGPCSRLLVRFQVTAPPAVAPSTNCGIVKL